MARALTRMERYARVVPMNPTLGHASAWVVNPIGDRVDRAWLFATYPPIADRIDRLRPRTGRPWPQGQCSRVENDGMEALP